MSNRSLCYAVARGMSLAVLGIGLAGAVFAVPAFPGYRDLAVYTASVPDAANPAKIVARTQFVNRGKAALRLAARLRPARALVFHGATYTARIKPGTTVVWTWSFTVPDGFQREVLTGEIVLNGRRERDLFLSILGTDPAGLDDGDIDRITERACVVATYAPRNRESIRVEMAALKARRPAPALTLAAAGKTGYAIVAEALPAPPEAGDAPAAWRAQPLTAPQRELVDALDDLQRIVRLQSGAVMPFRARPGGPAILLRLADPGPAATGLQDAYRLRTAGGDVVIEAKDLEGVRNGVYGLLTDHLDCHWFMPGTLGEEIAMPADRTVRLPALDEVRGSKWFSATVSGDLRNRARINRGRMVFGHSWDTYINIREYPFAKYPEYYARDRQGRIRKPGNNGDYTNFCSTNPAVIEIVARKVNAIFAANPDAVVASLDPNDYSGMCLCDRCLALDKQYGQTREDGGEVSDRLLHFSREIYDRLEPRFRDRYLGILVYAFQAAPPVSAAPHPRHAGTVCDMLWVYDPTRPFNDPTSRRNGIFHQQLAAWGSRLAQFGYYEYTGSIFFFGPWSLVHKLREDLPAFHELGGTYLHFEWQNLFATQGLNWYVSSLLAWDLDADVDMALEELFTKYYGPAAEPMRNYWMGMERLYNLERSGSSPSQRIFRRPESWAELDGCLREAGRIAAALPPAQKRFADRVQFTREGFEYTRLLSDYRFAYERPGADHAAALAYLEKYGPRIREIARTYPYDDPYWPPLAPHWAREILYSVDTLVKQERDALGKATLPK